MGEEKRNKRMGEEVESRRTIERILARARDS